MLQGSRIENGNDWPSWAAPALWNTAPGFSPFRAAELTKSSERVLKHLAVSLLTDGQLPWLMDVDEARSTLTISGGKSGSTGGERKTVAEAAAEAEQREGERVGAARKAFRAMIAARPVKCHRIVRNTGRVDVF